MSLLKGLGSLLGGDTIKDVGNIIDNLHTSEDEKLPLKQKLHRSLLIQEQGFNTNTSFSKMGSRYETW